MLPFSNTYQPSITNTWPVSKPESNRWTFTLDFQNPKKVIGKTLYGAISYPQTSPQSYFQIPLGMKIHSMELFGDELDEDFYFYIIQNGIHSYGGLKLFYRIPTSFNPGDIIQVSLNSTCPYKLMKPPKRVFLLADFERMFSGYNFNGYNHV